MSTAVSREPLERWLARRLLEQVKHCVETGGCTVSIEEVVERLKRQLQQLVQEGGLVYLHPWYADPVRRLEVFAAEVPVFEPLVVEVPTKSRLYVALVDGSLRETGARELAEAIRLVQGLLGSARLALMQKMKKSPLTQLVAGVLVARSAERDSIGYATVLRFAPVNERTVEEFRRWYRGCSGKVKPLEVAPGRRVVLTTADCLEQLKERMDRLGAIVYYTTYPYTNVAEKDREKLLKHIEYTIMVTISRVPTDLTEKLVSLLGKKQATKVIKSPPVPARAPAPAEERESTAVPS